MHQAFAQKLSITAATLNCATRKELCARFRTVNPTTEFELERSYKWLQGRALPRSHQVYEDWARLLGTQRSGTWLSACSTEAFLDEVCALFSADRATVEERARTFAGSLSQIDLKSAPADDPVCGTYVCFSWAWSPYQRGQLLRSHLRIAQKKRGVLDADYREILPGGELICHGQAHRDGTLLQFDVAAMGGGARERMSFMLLVPGRPVGLMCGRMQGAIVAGPHLQPSSTRAVFVRCGDIALDPRASCYFDADARAIGDELARILPPSGDLGPLANAIFGYLTSRAEGYVDQISGADLAALAEHYDRTHRGGADGPM